MSNKFIKVISALFRAGKSEVEEIKNLKPTDDDYRQGQEVATMAATALAACGVAFSSATIPVMAKVFTYAIRDIKDGVEMKDKLIISRVVSEIKGSI